MEVILGSATQSILGHLDSLISMECEQACGVQGELRRLEGTFSAISAGLREAEKCQVENESVIDRLKKLKGVIFDADDLLDEFSTEALRRRLMGGNQILKEVRSFFSSSNQLAFRFKMAHRIKQIRERLDAIKEDKLNFEFTGSGALEIMENRVRRDSYPFVREKRIIGREGDKRKIIDFLLNPNFDENVSILSIEGVGGLGKTALAKLVFSDESIQAYFKLKLWVCVSMNLDVEDIVRKIIRECTGEKDLGSFNMNELQGMLRDGLINNKFFLVLDDIWNVNQSEWMELQDMLMDGAKGSKILVTARAQSVTKATNASPFQLNGLPEAESLTLLMQMASKQKREWKNLPLEAIGKDIIGKCARVLLAIMTVGQLLQSLRNREEDWLNFKNLDLSRINQKTVISFQHSG